MKKIYLMFLVLLGCVITFSGYAASKTDQQSMLSIEQAYIRATIPGTSISSSYMEIENKSDNVITLERITSDASPRIEIHQHTMINGMMRMSKLNTLDIKSQERVKLQPSGLHLMLFDIKKPLKAQQKVELTLHFSNKESVVMTIPVYSPVQERTVQKSMPNMHKHHH